MKKKVILLWILIGVIATLVIIKNLQPGRSLTSTEIRTVKINSKIIAVEIADTPEERRLGLSGRENLKPDTGLLFVFDEPGYHTFWMKDMNFPIDIFWLDENYQIVDSWLNATPESYPETRTSKQLAKYVLETNVGEIKN